MNSFVEVDENDTFKIKKRSLPDIDGSCPEFY
jgi:hypothetical protein